MVFSGIFLVFYGIFITENIKKIPKNYIVWEILIFFENFWFFWNFTIISKTIGNVMFLDFYNLSWYLNYKNENEQKNYWIIDLYKKNWTIISCVWFVTTYTWILLASVDDCEDSAQIMKRSQLTSSSWSNLFWVNRTFF